MRLPMFVRSTATGLAARAATRGVVAVLATASLAAAAWGQGVPGGDGEPGVGSPFWGDGSRPNVEYVQRGPDGLPLTLIEQVPRAQYLYTHTKWQYRTAQANLGRLIDRRRADVLAEAGYDTAVRAEREAWADYQAARHEVVDDLMEESEFAALVRVQEQVQRQIEQERERSQPDEQAIRELAEAKLDYARRRTDMLSAALEADSEVDAARRVFLEAGDQVLAIEREAEDRITHDAEIAALRHEVEQLRIEYLALGKFNRATIRAADIALDYAGFSRRVDRYTPFYVPYGYGNGYDGYGYGYGVDYGFNKGVSGFFGGFGGSGGGFQFGSSTSGIRHSGSGRTPLSRPQVPFD